MQSSQPTTLQHTRAARANSSANHIATHTMRACGLAATQAFEIMINCINISIHCTCAATRDAHIHPISDGISPGKQPTSFTKNLSDKIWWFNSYVAKQSVIYYLDVFCRWLLNFDWSKLSFWLRENHLYWRHWPLFMTENNSLPL